MWWLVRAESDTGQLMTFGLHADDRDLAYLTALERLPWSPSEFTLEPVPSPRDALEWCGTGGRGAGKSGVRFHPAGQRFLAARSRCA